MFRTCAICCALAAAVGLTIGCNGTKDTKPAAGKEESLKSYETQLGGFDKQVDELKAKADKATGDEKAKLDAKVADATAKRAAFVKKLDEAKASATDKQDGMKGGVGAAFDDYKKAVE